MVINKSVVTSQTHLTMSNNQFPSNYLQQKHNNKLFFTSNVLDSLISSEVQSRNQSKNSVKKNTEFTNNDFITKSTYNAHKSNSTPSISTKAAKIDSSTTMPWHNNSNHNKVFESKTQNSNKLSSHSVYLLKLAQNEFSVMTMRRFKKDEFILQHIGDKAMTENFLQLKHEYSNLNIYYNCFMENHRNNTMNSPNGNILVPFILRCNAPNCYIQITKDDRFSSRNSEDSLYRVGIFASVDIESGVELTLGLNLKEMSNLIPLNTHPLNTKTTNTTAKTSKNETNVSRTANETSASTTVNVKSSSTTTNAKTAAATAAAAAAAAATTTIHLTSNFDSSSSKFELSKDPFPMSFQITPEERRNHNRYRNLITAIQILENSIVNYCIKHASDPLVSPIEKLTATAIILFGLPQSTFSRIHAIISICLQEHITIEQCQTCLLNAFRLFIEWKTTTTTATNNNNNNNNNNYNNNNNNNNNYNDNDNLTTNTSSKLVPPSTTSTVLYSTYYGVGSSHHQNYYHHQNDSKSDNKSGSRNESSSIKISLFEKFITCFLLSIKGAFDVIPIPIYKWSEKLNIPKYKLVRWELECLKAVRFEAVITSALYFCWLARICDELEV